MKITSSMVVPNGIKDDAADVRPCGQCGGSSFWTPQWVMVLSRSGARSMRLWTCEEHRLPDTVTDDPEVQ